MNFCDNIVWKNGVWECVNHYYVIIAIIVLAILFVLWRLFMPQQVTVSLSITVSEPLKVDTTSLPNATLNTPYNVPVQVEGGTPPYKFDVSGGSLPTGLNIDPASGVISGTPTAAGTSQFSVQVTDSSQ